MLSSLQTILHIHQPFLSVLEHLLHRQWNFGRGDEADTYPDRGTSAATGHRAGAALKKWKRGLRGALPPRGSAR